ncbi:hypothetical protein [Deinococcus cellulosilyticus]|nr:hypothetical protein [Deinococcus cellulosilyticus]
MRRLFLALALTLFPFALAQEKPAQQAIPEVSLLQRSVIPDEGFGPTLILSLRLHPLPDMPLDFQLGQCDFRYRLKNQDGVEFPLRKYGKIGETLCSLQMLHVKADGKNPAGTEVFPVFQATGHLPDGTYTLTGAFYRTSLPDGKVLGVYSLRPFSFSVPVKP